MFELVVVSFELSEFSVEGVLLRFGGDVGFLDKELIIEEESRGRHS